MPEVKYGLAISFGCSYGLEEAQALMECLQNNAPSCGEKVKEFENAFVQLGAKLVFCDIDERTMCMDPEKSEKANNSKNKGNCKDGNSL